MDRTELTYKQIECWNRIKPFQKNTDNFYIIPSIPVCNKEDYNNIIIPNLLRCGAIPKDQLKVGTTYYGKCRKSNKATWNGEQFIYDTYEWRCQYKERINHFEDDNGFDLFIPIEEVKE